MENLRFAIEIIGAIGVLFNMFIDWPKFIDRIKGTRHVLDSNEPLLPSVEKKRQAVPLPNLIIAIILWGILIANSISLVNFLNSDTFGHITYLFLLLVFLLFISLILIRGQSSWLNSFLISAGVVLVYFYGYSYFAHPGWTGLTLPIDGDQSVYIEYYKWLPFDSFDCMSYPINIWYSGQSSSRIRFEYDESSFSFVGDNCDSISNEWEFTPVSGYFGFFLIPKFESDSQQATKVYLKNISDNSLISSEPLEIFIENRFFSIVRQIFPFYFLAVLTIYLVKRKKKNA